MAAQGPPAIDDCNAATEPDEHRQIAQLEASNAALTAQVAQLQAENQRLRNGFTASVGAETAIRDPADLLPPRLLESQIQTQEAFLCSIYEGVEMGIFVLDVTPEGEFCFAGLNPAYERIVGLTKAQLLGKTLPEAQFPATVTQTYQRCRATGSPLYYEESAVLHGRKTHWYTTLAPVALEGHVVRMIGTCIDITHLKQMEDQLRRSEARFKAISDSLPANIYTLVRRLDGSFYFEHISQSVEHLHEVSVEAVLADPMVLIGQIHPEDQAGYETAVQHSVETREAFSYEWRIVTPSGRVKWLKGRSQPRHRANGEIAWYGVAIDISDRKRIEVEHQQTVLDLQHSLHQLVATQTALQVSEMQLSSVLNSSLDGIMAFRAQRDETHAIVDFEWLLSNPAACKLVQRSAETLVGRRLLQEMPIHATNGLFEGYMQVVETGHPWQHEFHHTHQGCTTWMELIAVQLGDGFAVTFRDITAIKRSELALQAVNQQLEQQVNQLNQRNTEMQLLSAMSDFLQTCLTVDEAYAALALLIAPLFPGCGGGVAAASSATSDNNLRLKTVAQWGAPAGADAFLAHRCWALRQRQSYWVDATTAKPRCHHLATAEGTFTALCVPIIAQGDILGLLYLTCGTPEGLAPNQRQLAKTVAEQLALALANLHLRETLRHQSIRDPLTGLFNRRYLEEFLQNELISAQRHGHPIGVIMLDLDHFKQFNDTHGHDAGDRALQAVAQRLKDSVRGSDIACRYGGEEITLVLPDLALVETQARAEDIRRAIATLTWPAQTASLTASLGVACFPQHGVTADRLLKAADTALYQAKQAGRNCVVAAEG